MFFISLISVFLYSFTLVQYKSTTFRDITRNPPTGYPLIISRCSGLALFIGWAFALPKATQKDKPFRVAFQSWQFTAEKHLLTLFCGVVCLLPLQSKRINFWIARYGSWGSSSTHRPTTRQAIRWVGAVCVPFSVIPLRNYVTWLRFFAPGFDPGTQCSIMTALRWEVGQR